MENNIKNKVLIILLIFLILITTYSSVFASSTVTYIDRFGQERTYINISDDINLKNGFLQKTNNAIFALDDNSYFYMQGDGVYISGSVRVIGWHYNTWVDEGNGAFPNNYRVALLSEVCYTTVDIYNNINKTGVELEGSESFFPHPPTTMKEMMTQVGEQSKAEILPTILKVIAIAVGLVISLIALRKAFQILVTGLKT